MLNSNKNKKAFTLIELLVVISVIGVLATIVISNTGRAAERAQIAKVESELTQIERLIDMARFNNDDVLINITGHGCSHCACRYIDDLSVLPDDHSCIVNMTNFFESLGHDLMRDPWGSPYLVDENEGEFPDNICRADGLSSAGPSKSMSEGDNINRIISFYLPECK